MLESHPVFVHILTCLLKLYLLSTYFMPYFVFSDYLFCNITTSSLVEGIGSPWLQLRGNLTQADGKSLYLFACRHEFISHFEYLLSGNTEFRGKGKGCKEKAQGSSTALFHLFIDTSLLWKLFPSLNMPHGHNFLLLFAVNLIKKCSTIMFLFLH